MAEAFAHWSMFAPSITPGCVLCQDAVARNALADAISASLTGLGAALLNGAAADTPPIKIEAPSFTGVFAKQSITPDPTLPPPKLEAGGPPKALFVAQEDAEAALSDGDADGFVVPSTLPALQVPRRTRT